MRDVTGKGCKLAGVETRSDLALHDLTGGNQWMTKILASADLSSPNYDPYNYAILSGTKYSGASIEVGGLQGVGPALLAGSDRAVQQLQMAATMTVVNDTTSAVTLKVQNNTGHRLTSGFPEGRRMFLTVKFYDGAGALISEIKRHGQYARELHAFRRAAGLHHPDRSVLRHPQGMGLRALGPLAA